MKEKLTFEDKFFALGQYYDIKSPSEIKNQIKENENIFIFLEKIKPFLEESFADADFSLEMNFEPESSNKFIILLINVSEERFNNGIGDEIRNLDFKIWNLEKSLDVSRDVLIMPEIKNV